MGEINAQALAEKHAGLEQKGLLGGLSILGHVMNIQTITGRPYIARAALAGAN